MAVELPNFFEAIAVADLPIRSAIGGDDRLDLIMQSQSPRFSVQYQECLPRFYFTFMLHDNQRYLIIFKHTGSDFQQALPVFVKHFFCYTTDRFRKSSVMTK